MAETKKGIDVEKLGESFGGFANNAAQAVLGASHKVADIATMSRDAIVQAVDQNENGEIDIEDIIILGLRTPGIQINRSDFLQKELFRNYPQEIIDDAIAYSPAHAHIPLEEINKIADEVIQFERNCVSGISAALGAPGGFAMVATIPADIAQDRKSVV